MYSTLRLPELREELRKRGASLRGKKADLVERLEMYDKHCNLTQPDPDTEDISMKTPPCTSFKDVNSNTVLPPLNTTLIRQYLNFTTKKLDQALHLYESRFLTVVRSSWTEDSCYIKGFCKKTMKTLQYEVNVELNKEGPPEKSHCECPAGSGVNATCKHVAVLLYAIENMVQQKCIILSEVCTQQLQKWNCPSKKYTGSPVKADKLPRKRPVKRLLFAPYPVENIDRESYNYKIRNLVLAFPNSTMPIKQCYEPANPYAIETDHNYLNMDARRNLLEELKLVDITDADIQNIQESTINQTESKEWHFHRKIRLTSSIFHTICHLRETTKGKYAREILERKGFSSRATTHGLLNEKVALSQYCANNDLQIEPCGLFVSKERPYLAASPDGLLGSQTRIEIKCPYASRFMDIKPNTVPYLFEEKGALQLKTSSPYYFQIQGQLYCTGRDFCNLIVYTFKDLKVIFVSRDDAFIANMLIKLELFYECHFKEVLFNKYLYYNCERIM